MNHSFDIEIAKLYGIEEAILIENIAFWIKKNIANNKNNYNGYTWIYNSATAFNELFPYITPSKIRRSLLNLEEKKILLSNNYNKLKYDRTKWYTIIEETILQNYNIHYSNCKMEVKELNNGNEQIVEPIPYINKDINTNINKYIDICKKPKNENIETIELKIKNKENTNIYKDIEIFINTLNLKTGKKYKKTKSIEDNIKKLYSEDFTKQDILTVINKMCDYWLNTKYENGLTPSKLFDPNKFDEWLNLDINKNKEKKLKEEEKKSKILI